MALVEGLRQIYNVVVDGIKGGYDDGDEVFEDMENEDEYEEEYEEDGGALRRIAPAFAPIFERRSENNVVELPTKNKGVNDVVIVEPRAFEDAATIVQHLKDRKIVMLNLHLLGKEQSQRTIDFVCGAAQALNGTPKKVGELTFVFAPSNVNISADAMVPQNKFNDTMMWSTSLQ